ncbi:WD40-repeat-containing domain protein [Calycina marina]|uniref:WD40-repeat-containing domain protein n=1 Tax=Calycina marina TaxID=1763456 RepID=A0A9P7Z831_9HELO|nr:WD40-repeat-containing domain protein [Calycina marina]
MEAVKEAKAYTLVASTRDIYSCTNNKSRPREGKLPDGQAPTHEPYTGHGGETSVNHFKSAQWSADGTSLLTSSADNTIRTFILPPDLISSGRPITLAPYTSHTLPTSINCIAPYPHFALSSPTTTLYLSTPTDLPIRLSNVLYPSSNPVCTYTLQSPTTEAYLTPSSILWSPGATSFLTGTDCLIAVFDVSRSGANTGPVSRFPTIPSKRHKMKGGGIGMRGTVSALSTSPSDDPLLAAGTWTRWVGLYDSGGMGGTVATWSIAEAADKVAGIGGAGVTQTLWSSCGRYLYVVERKSDGVLVFDVRVTGKLIGWLEGRNADTNQRLGVDTFSADGGMEVWAGGGDGIVRIWEGVGLTEGGVKRNWEWKAHDDPITSTVVHGSGTVVATCSGQRQLYDYGTYESESSESESDANSDSDESRTSNGSGRSSRRSSPSLSSIGSSHLPVATKQPDNSVKVWSI